MNDPILTHVGLCYQTLVPVTDPDDYFLSIGTITLHIPQPLHLDFNMTIGSFERISDGTNVIKAEAVDFEPSTHLSEYQAQGFQPEGFTYSFFASLYKDSSVQEVHTEFGHCVTDLMIPLTLCTFILCFSDGSELDYSDRISVFALNELADVA